MADFIRSALLSAGDPELLLSSVTLGGVAVAAHGTGGAADARTGNQWDQERLAWAGSVEMKSRLKPHCKSILGDARARRHLEGRNGAAGAQAEGKEQQSSSTSVQRGAGNSPVTPRGLIHEQSPSCWAGRV